MADGPSVTVGVFCGVTPPTDVCSVVTSDCPGRGVEMVTFRRSSVVESELAEAVLAHASVSFFPPDMFRSLFYTPVFWLFFFTSDKL